MYICEESRKITRNYLLDNDGMLAWFLENFQKIAGRKYPAEGKKPVKLKDVCSMWKDSDLYDNLSIE